MEGEGGWMDEWMDRNIYFGAHHRLLSALGQIRRGKMNVHHCSVNNGYAYLVPHTRYDNDDLQDTFLIICKLALIAGLCSNCERIIDSTM